MAELTLVGLRVVREVARLRSITAAADELGYTQSAVSRQVAAAEAAVGAPLFDRQARGVRPTPAGELVASRAAEVLGRLDTVSDEIDALHDELVGRVRLDAFPVAMTDLVPRSIARLAADHPSLQVHTRDYASPALVARVRSRRTHVAVIAVGADLPRYDLGGLRAEQLLEGRFRLAVAAGHPLARRRRVRRDELRDLPWIVGEGPRGEPQFEAWPTLDDPRIAYAVRSWDARLGFVAAGLGVCVVPYTTPPAGVPAGVRVVAVDDPQLLPRSVLAVTGPDRTRAQDAVVTALHDAAATIG